MKINKLTIKQIILEEVKEDKQLAKAIEKLAVKIDDLDISIDYLSAAITGDSAARIGGAQSALGRLAQPGAKSRRSLEEKELTSAEYKKKKEIADAIEDDDPDMPDSKKYAIATAAAKKSTDK